MNKLTNAELDRIEDLHKDTKLINMPFSPDGFLFGIMHQNLPSLISAARERNKAVEALREVSNQLSSGVNHFVSEICRLFCVINPILACNPEDAKPDQVSQL